MTEEHPGDGPVDFVVGDDSPSSSTLTAAADGPPGSDAEGLREPPQRPHRLGIAAAVLVLALVVVGVVLHGRAHPRQTADRPSAPPSSASTSPARPAPVPGGRQVFDVLPDVTRPPICPEADDGQPACYGQPQVPAAFRRSVHANFPHVRQTSADTQLMRPGLPLTTAGLWSRSYTATGRGLTVQIYVRRGAEKQPLGLASLDNGAHMTVVSEQSVGHYTVEVQVTGVSGADIDQRAVNTLASDRRLIDTP